ncbi:MAG: glycoside hydrolase family 28 protein [Clostridiales bacterium]
MININDLNIYNILDYGAVANKNTLSKNVINLAINECSKNNGGIVLIPAGDFLTGPIEMKSNVTLMLGEGSTLYFTNEIDEYPLVQSRWEGLECLTYAPLIYGKNVSNIKITGQGTLIGNGQFWWKSFKNKQLNYPRPRFICFENSKRVLIENIKIVDSPSWTINPICCENMTINNLTINNSADSPNTDGINPDSSKNVHISNCNIDVGDDCIAIKSGVEDSKHRIPCENIVITNCTLLHGHGAVVIGSEMSGDVRNITISNCVFENTDRGIRLKSRRGRGGVIENVTFSNIVMKKVMCPIVMNLYYFCGKGGKDKHVSNKNKVEVTEATPIIRNINISNVHAVEVQAAAGFIYGLPEMLIDNISLDNVFITMDKNAVPDTPAMMDNLEPMSRNGFFVNNASNLKFNNVTIKNHMGLSYNIINVDVATFNQCNLNYNDDSQITIVDSKNISINNCIMNDETLVYLNNIKNKYFLSENYNFCLTQVE